MMRKLIIILSTVMFLFSIQACSKEEAIPPEELREMLDFLEARTEKRVNKHLAGNYTVDTDSKIDISLYMKMDGLFDYVEFDDQVSEKQKETLVTTMEALQPIKEYFKYGWHDDLARLRISVYPLLEDASPLDFAVTDAKNYARKLARSEYIDKCEPYTEYRNGVERRTPKQLVCVVDLFMPTMNKVYNVAREANPELEGTIIFKLKIKGTGSMAYADILDSDIGNSDFEQKILSIFRQIRFPSHGAMDNTLELTYPVNFFVPKED